MIEKEFPYKGWVLTPSFKPVEKTFVSLGYCGYHRADSEKDHHPDNIFKDKASAIAWGREDLERQRAALEKKLDNIEKRSAALDKAAS